MTPFIQWLRSEIAYRGWSYSELAKRADIHRNTVSAVMTGKNKVSWEFCARVAQALSVSPIELFRKAELLDPIESEADLDVIMEIISKLDPQDRAEIFEYAKYRYQRASNNK